MRLLILTFAILLNYTLNQVSKPCDRQLPDSVKIFGSGEFGRHDKYPMTMIGTKNMDSCFTGFDFQPGFKHSLEVPEKDSCSLKRLYFKYLDSKK